MFVEHSNFTAKVAGPVSVNYLKIDCKQKILDPRVRCTGGCRHTLISVFLVRVSKPSIVG